MECPLNGHGIILNTLLFDHNYNYDPTIIYLHINLDNVQVHHL